MTKFKKLTAILLSVLCVFSVFSVSCFAEEKTNIFDELSSALTDEPMLDCIVYQKETLSDVSMMYKPNPSASFSGPGYVTVTRDTPIAVDHNFVCWKGEDGTLYYEGDKVYVKGEVTLYAVWEEKKDNDPHVLRVLKTAFETLQRMLQKLLGIFKDAQDFESEYSSSMAETTIAESTETTSSPTTFTGEYEDYTGGSRN